MEEEKDRFLGKELTYGTEEYVQDLRIRHILNWGCLHNSSKRGIKSLMAEKWQIYVSLLLRF